MTTLFPRLTTDIAYSLWNEYQGKSIEELRNLATCKHQAETYASTGGAPIAIERLKEFGDSMREIAGKSGFPGSRTTKGAAGFDHELSAWLAENIEIIRGEALRQEVWSFMCLCVIPDIVKWRFPDFHSSRCLGGRRNCLQRLWLRAKAFDLGDGAKDRWVLLKVLTEDAFVSVIERPSLSGNPKICKVIGVVWYETAKKVGREKMEAINRNAIRRLRAKSVLYYLDSYKTKALKEVVEKCYEESVN